MSMTRDKKKIFAKFHVLHSYIVCGFFDDDT